MAKPNLDHITPDLRPLAVAVSSLTPDPRNARLHDERNLEATMTSLTLYGQRKPIVVNKRDQVIEAGNGTLACARQLGWTHIAAVFVDDDPTMATGYAVADNRTAELAEWDDDQLAELLQELSEAECDLASMGWSVEEVEEILGASEGSGGGDDPGPTEPPAKPKSKLGRVYKLGPHRVMCGDSTNAKHVSKLLAGATPNLMVTDPPYGVEYDPGWRADADLNQRGGGVRSGTVENDDRADWREAWALFPGGVAYVWHASLHGATVLASLVAEKFTARSQIIWVKPSLVISRGHYHYQHEPCWYLVRDGKTAMWAGDRKQSTVWMIAGDKTVAGDKKHGTQKPLECMERPIRNHEGDVYDPFLGSGTTLIAADRQRRTLWGMELDPAYVDVIRRRWGDYKRGKDEDPGKDAL